jgi:hypothetical protein
VSPGVSTKFGVCQCRSAHWEVVGEYHEHPNSNLSSPGYLLLGLLAMLLAVETFSELPQIRAMVKFFGSKWHPKPSR